MRRLVLLFVLAVCVAAATTAPTVVEGKENPVVVISTSLGDMEVELYADKAPITVQNFLWYVDNKFYDGLIFHRVIANFMIQGGGFTKDMEKKEGNAPIENEATNGLSNEKYTIAMARLPAVHSASSQFFINNKDNPGLDHKNKTAQGFGYCVFGKVIAGTEVVDKISAVETGVQNGMQDVPLKPVLIKRAYRAAPEPEKEKKKEG